jgi:L-serine dehydratase
MTEYDMAHSIFDLFKAGIGPSSSHTVGPMVACNRFINLLSASPYLVQTARIQVDLYGSLALTGKGHATDIACTLGLLSQTPDRVNPDNIPALLKNIKETNNLPLCRLDKTAIKFCPKEGLIFNFTKFLPEHPNGMTISALNDLGTVVLVQTYFSVGGGFVLDKEELAQEANLTVSLPYPFESARELLCHCQESQRSITQIMLANERALGTTHVLEKIDGLWKVMSACIERGIATDGILPGSLKLKRRAYGMHQRLLKTNSKEQFDTLDWVNLYAMAVNEENAAGGRVVTAPTNGAAGVIPAVMAWFLKFKSKNDQQGIIEFMTTAAAIGLLYKRNASISAAEVGCQGEIGVACSMAAAGLTAAMGGTPEQIENAAEIGMEHNLGLTCDPINGLVQVPCIERNTMGALKAINASRLALQSDGIHHVHLDDVIKTMHQTGLDMMSKYKETSQGGLAINVVAC